MIAILCKSDALGEELARLAAPEAFCLCGGERPASSVQRLRDCLGNDSVSIVFYESDYFIDPAPFRAISPNTKFVFLASPEDQEPARTALVSGACAVITKPFTAQDVLGVLSLVSD